MSIVIAEKSVNCTIGAQVSCAILTKGCTVMYKTFQRKSCENFRKGVLFCLQKCYNIVYTLYSSSDSLMSLWYFARVRAILSSLRLMRFRSDDE